VAKTSRLQFHFFFRLALTFLLRFQFSQMSSPPSAHEADEYEQDARQ
jgi:hypothetical protein